jgi:hypothetical protein
MDILKLIWPVLPEIEGIETDLCVFRVLINTDSGTNLTANPVLS